MVSENGPHRSLPQLGGGRSSPSLLAESEYGVKVCVCACVCVWVCVCVEVSVCVVFVCVGLLALVLIHFSAHCYYGTLGHNRTHC